MGHDVHNIGRHKLDTSSLVALAKDLALRFKAHIEYGVYDTFWFDWDGFPREASYAYWVFGKIEYPGAQKTLWLTDEYYQHHIVYGRYGNDAYKLPYFNSDKFYQQELKDTINNLCFELRDNANNNEYGTIYNDVFHDFYNYFYSRWGSFCRSFTNDYNLMDIRTWDDIYYTEMYKYRKQVMQFFRQIGGSEVFYFDDQGESQILTDVYYDWKTILKIVAENFKDTTLHISEFMKNKHLLPKDTFYLAYYDDFTDLQTNQ